MTLTLIITGIVIVYRIHCLIWPYKPCRVCNGHKRQMAADLGGDTGDAYRRCWWCKGSGERLRLGARVLRRKARV